jgi:exopolyphosphatase / guanosine-5'-triphosphate,3'-diphosphate pyrophosphatase
MGLLTTPVFAGTAPSLWACAGTNSLEPRMNPEQLYAAVDLGSNAFRLEINCIEHGHLRRVDYLKETIRQGKGLNAQGELSQEAMEQGWACLARFGERLRGFDPEHVRVAATQTLREARNRDVFVATGSAILGFPIEVISGPEEARLIYLGVTHFLPPNSERRLVIDIGGRSTELVMGQGFQTKALASYPVGSVSWSTQYFPDSAWTAAAFKRAQTAAMAVLEDVPSVFARTAWDTVYASSGTSAALATALASQGWSPEVLTQVGLNALQAQLIEAQSPEHLVLEGLSKERIPVLAGAVAVSQALMALTDGQDMQIAQGAMRHGLLCDVVQRESPQTDIRTRMVQSLCNRFSVDMAQAQRVSRVAATLLDQLLHNAPADTVSARLHNKLLWAAQLHEIGAQISHDDSHKHGAYILQNSDVLGFSVNELQRLSLLVLGHRGKLRKLGDVLSDEHFALQLVALRLAVIFCHARNDPDTDGAVLKSDKKGFTLHLPAAWTESHPQSAYLLEQECLTWEGSPWRLAIHTA